MRLTIPVQTVAVVATAQGIIDNGGFRYFFGGDFPNNPSYSIFIDGYKRIGATHIADQLEKAINLFPFQTPHKYENWRKNYIESISEDHEFYKIEDLICGNQSVWDLLDKYIEKHNKYFTA